MLSLSKRELLVIGTVYSGAIIHGKSTRRLELDAGQVIADLVEGRDCVFLGGLYRAERSIADRLRILSRGSLPWKSFPDWRPSCNGFGGGRPGRSLRREGSDFRGLDERHVAPKGDGEVRQNRFRRD
jgi:hypothetical protein